MATPCIGSCHDVGMMILGALDKNCMVVLVMTDLSSAFDTIDHSIMLRCFEHSYGITGQALKWLQSYIENRTQSVAIGTARSSPRNMYTRPDHPLETCTQGP